MKTISTLVAATLMLSFGAAIPVLTAPAFAQQAATEAAQQTVTFAVQNMTCALCPVTVKRAMEGVDGVRSVEIDFEARTATVVFDPRVTTAARIAAASTNAGYPATARG